MTFQNAKIVRSGISYAEYSKQDAQRGDKAFVMSRGELMDFAACPHKWISGYRSPDTKASEWGSLIDCLTLNRYAFDELFAVCPATYENDKGEVKDWNFNAAVCKEWKKKQGARRIIKRDAVIDAGIAKQNIFSNPCCADLLLCSKTQVMATAEWHDDATDIVIPLRTLIDLVPDKQHKRFGKCLADLKTAASANPHDFENQIFHCDYDAQAALYLDVYTAATDEDRIEWRFILQENSEPYEVADPLPMLSQEFIDIGRAKYKRALKLYAQCLESNSWPSYSPGHRTVFGDVYLAEPKPWMQTAIMDDWPTLPRIAPLTNLPIGEEKELVP